MKEGGRDYSARNVKESIRCYIMRKCGYKINIVFVSRERQNEREKYELPVCFSSPRLRLQHCEDAFIFSPFESFAIDARVCMQKHFMPRLIKRSLSSRHGFILALDAALSAH